MKQCDLGVLDGPVLIFGGPYSNLQATEAVLDQAIQRGIAPSNVICTGDIVAYCGQPVETIAAIRSHGCAVVAGNCEKQLAVYQDNCGCGFEAGTTCDLLSAGWYAHASATVGAEDRRWMGALPDMITFTHQGMQSAVIHGGVQDISRFIWPSYPDAVFQEEIFEIQVTVPQISCIFAGHSGLSFQRKIGNVRWVNAGVVGMPPHDGGPESLTQKFMFEQNALLSALSRDEYRQPKPMLRNFQRLPPDLLPNDGNVPATRMFARHPVFVVEERTPRLCQGA